MPNDGGLFFVTDSQRPNQRQRHLAFCEVVAEEYRVPVKRVGVQDVFGQSGEVDELMHAYGLTSDNLVKTAKDVMKHRI